jgi:dipeptidase E
VQATISNNRWGIDRAVNRYAVLTGAGFSEGRMALDRITLGLAGAESPQVCFLPTASGDAVGYIDRFHNAFAETQARHEHLPLFKGVRPECDSLLSDQDIIYIGGGSTANLLAVWRVHGVDSAVTQAYRSGVIVMGISAGAACLFSSCLTDSFGDLRELRDGMGILGGSFCPHYRSEPGRRSLFLALVRSGALDGGYGLDDGAMAVFENEQLIHVIAENDGATIWSVHKGENGQIVEYPVLDHRYFCIGGTTPT